MQLTITDDRGTEVGSRGGESRGASPLENPSLAPIPDDPLAEPHPAEPGVESDGTAAPLENPDDSTSADALAGFV